jgi:hypothetical protein
MRFVWIGNWGDDERSAELTEFLVARSQLKLSGRVYGVRYPQAGAANDRSKPDNLWRMAPQPPGAAGFCAGASDRARPARPLCATAARHPHNSHVRSTGLRHSAGFSAMVRRRTAVSFRLLSQRKELRNHEVGALGPAKRWELAAPFRARRITRGLGAAHLPAPCRKNCWRSSTPRSFRAGTEFQSRSRNGSHHEDMLLWLEPCFLLLEWCCHLLPRHLESARDRSGTRSFSLSRMRSSGRVIGISRPQLGQGDRLSGDNRRLAAVARIRGALGRSSGQGQRRRRVRPGTRIRDG